MFFPAEETLIPRIITGFEYLEGVEVDTEAGSPSLDGKIGGSKVEAGTHASPRSSSQVQDR
jgi:hypothetical protein